MVGVGNRQNGISLKWRHLGVQLECSSRHSGAAADVEGAQGGAAAAALQQRSHPLVADLDAALHRQRLHAFLP